MKKILKCAIIIALSVGALGITQSCKENPSPPVLLTVVATEVTYSSAISGGVVSDDGGSEVTDRGVCWDTSPNPTISSNKTSNGKSTGSFTSSITGLTANTKYYVRAYATNSVGTAYGNEISFISGEAMTATVTTASVVSVYSTSAVSGGEILSDGGSAVREWGVCWNTSENPTKEVNAVGYTMTGDEGGMGAFIGNLSWLIPATTYYVRAYAINSAGIAYGDQLSFKTDVEVINPAILNPDLTYGSVSDIDGNNYKTIQIGTQLWMAENLKTTKYNDGNQIDNVVDFVEWSGLNTGAYCWYGNNAGSYKPYYGGLYNWFAVNTGKLCPTDWHIPSDEEWATLSAYLGGNDIAGGKLKETGTSHWQGPNTGATNESGFTALPGGTRVVWGDPDIDDFSWFYSVGYWWSASENIYNTAKFWAISYNGSRIGNEGLLRQQSGLSIRCVKDL
jgi:uncharacterized protein (TIGR02145 family)